jgi:hypothetical protein
MSPPALGAHERERAVRAVEDAHHVDMDHPPPLLGGRARDRPEEHHPRVVDERIQAPESLVCARDEGFRLGLLTDVGGDGQRFTARLLDPPGERLDAFGPPGCERHRRSGPRARQRGGLADPRGCAGHRHHAALELAHAEITAASIP